MALFAIQLVRVVFTIYLEEFQASQGFVVAYELVILIHQMLNVIINICSFSTSFVFTDDIYLSRASHRQ